MENFYDINNFFMFIIKKLKSLIAITCIVIIVFAGNRALGLYSQYKSQGSANQNTKAVNDSEDPMWIRYSTLISIDTVYKNVGGTQFDITGNIVNSIYDLSYSDEVLNKLYDNWFDKEKTEDISRKQQFYKYGYILEKESKYNYTKYDFYQQFLINGIDLISVSKATPIGSESRTFNIGFMSTNKQLASDISKDYVNILMKTATEKLSGLKYENLGSSTLYSLPGRSDGAQPTRVSSDTAITNKITMSYILKQTVKGVVWGAILGICISVLLIFFMFMMSHRINTVADIEKLNIKISGLGFIKSKKYGIKAKFYRLIEGMTWDDTGYCSIAKKVSDDLKDGDKLLVISTSDKKYSVGLVKLLNDSNSGCSVDFAEYNNINKDVLSNYNKVLLTEVFCKSLKSEVKSEIEFLLENKCDIKGIVGLQ